MKKMILLPVTALVILSLGLSSCKKKKDDVTDDPPANTTPSKPSDQAGSATADDAMDDVRDMVNNYIGGGSGKRVGLGQAYNLPCGVVSVDSSTTNTNGKKIYTVNYGHASPCGYQYKSGSVTFELTSGSTYADVNAMCKVTFTNYEVLINATNQTVKLNGVLTARNSTGGYIWEAVTASATITHKIRGSLNITYNGTDTRVRNFFQSRTWSSSSGWAGLTYTANGDSTVGAAQVSETGKTLEGNYDFQTEVTTPFSWSNCGTTWAGPYVLKSGNATYNVTVPGITPTYINVEAGYYWDTNNMSSTPTLVNGCNSNTYKIYTVLGPITSTTYQLY